MNIFQSSFNKIVKKLFNWEIFGAQSTVIPNVSLQPKLDINKFLVNNFFKISQTKNELINEINSIRDFYFSQLIIDRIVEDSLFISSNKNLFNVEIIIDGKKDNSLTQFVEEKIKELNFQKILMDISYDLLYYGEYALRVDVVDNQINLKDDVDLAQIIPVYRDSSIAYFLTIKDKKLTTESPINYVWFELPGNRIKVKIDGLDNKIAYLRMGRSVLFPVIGLLKELMFLENAIPNMMIKKLVKTQLVGVSIPSGTKPSQAIEISKQYQELINRNLNVNIDASNLDELLNEISNKVGNIKVIPVWSDKGELSTQDIEPNIDVMDLQDKIDDLRKMCLNTVGIPGDILDDTNLKLSELKQAVRYSKKLRMLQNALKAGIIHFIEIILNINGFNNISKKNIHVNFTNVVNVEDIEKNENLALLISTLEDFNNFVENLEGKENIKVNEKTYIEFLNSQFQDVLGFTLFEYKEDDEVQNED